MILDDLVLDVTQFANAHPGGRFLIHENNGRDISKFFHGGYSFEPLKKSSNHTHTNVARRIVNSLIVARLDRRREQGVFSIEKTKSAENIVETFTFNLPEGSQEKFCNFYPGFKMLGKHYLVQSLKTDAIKDDGNFSIMGNKRHYTVANTMRPEVYNSLVDTLR